MIDESGVRWWLVDISHWHPSPAQFDDAPSLLLLHDGTTISRYHADGGKEKQGILKAVIELILGISRKLQLERRHLVGKWATDLCRKKTMQSPRMAREMLKLAIHLTPAPDDMILVYEVSTELMNLMTSGDDGDSSDTFHIINCKTKSSLAALSLFK